MTNIELIQEWYKNQCNGDWEHEYGVKIETMDNPGWIVSIDLVDTFLQGFEYQYSKKGEEDWIELVSDGKVFRGAGDFLKLDEILDKFINEFALPNIKNAKQIYEIYEEIPLSIGINVYRQLNAMPISLTEFEIVEIPEFDFKDLKVVDIEDFQKMTFQEGEISSRYRLGDRGVLRPKNALRWGKSCYKKLKSIPK